MGYVLTPDQLAEFTELRDLIRGTLDPSDSTYWTGTSADFVGRYYLAYQFLADVQTTTMFPFRRCWNYAIASAALLAMSCSVANAESFSIKCIYGPGVIYMSFDTDSGKVVEETLSGQPLKGRIDKVDGDRIDFHIVIPGRPDMDIVWDGGKKTLKVLAIPGDKYRTGDIVECAGTELRSMLSHYDSM
jgi:hypothetical protein